MPAELVFDNTTCLLHVPGCPREDQLQGTPAEQLVELPVHRNDLQRLGGAVETDLRPAISVHADAEIREIMTAAKEIVG